MKYARFAANCCGRRSPQSGVYFLRSRSVDQHVERAWKMLMEFRVPGDDHGYRSSHGFVDIPGDRNRL